MVANVHPIDESPDMHLDVSLVTIDSTIAQEWLTHNATNRPVRRTLVARYRSDMAAGRWDMAGDSIRFDRYGNLLDGQHRLLALAELDDVTLPVLVIRGLPPESQLVMDQGGKRTSGDQLSLLGIRNANNVAAAVRVYLLWQEGYLFRATKVGRFQISSPQIQDWVLRNEGLVEAFNSHLTAIRSNDAPPMVAGAAALAFLKIDEPRAIEFFTLLAKGAGTEGHPIVTLDKRLQRIRREKKARMNDRDYLALFILTWNAWVSGRTLTRFPKSNYTLDTFPVPVRPMEVPQSLFGGMVAGR